jgi:hypothetical protein
MVTIVMPSALREDFPANLDRWYVTKPPELGSPEWLSANNDAEYEWAVTLGKNGAQVKLGAQGESASPPSLGDQTGFQQGGLERQADKHQG